MGPVKGQPVESLVILTAQDVGASARCVGRTLPGRPFFIRCRAAGRRSRAAASGRSSGPLTADPAVWLHPPAATQQGSRAHQGRSSTQAGTAPTPTTPGAETDQGGRQRPPHQRPGEGAQAAAHAIGGRPDRGRPGGTQGGTDRAQRPGGDRTGRPLTRRTGRAETGRHDQPARGPSARRARAAGGRARRRRSGGPWGAGRPAWAGGDPTPIGQATPGRPDEGGRGPETAAARAAAPRKAARPGPTGRERSRRRRPGRPDAWTAGSGRDGPGGWAWGPAYRCYPAVPRKAG